MFIQSIIFNIYFQYISEQVKVAKKPTYTPLYKYSEDSISVILHSIKFCFLGFDIFHSAIYLVFVCLVQRRMQTKECIVYFSIKR